MGRMAVTTRATRRAALLAAAGSLALGACSDGAEPVALAAEAAPAPTIAPTAAPATVPPTTPPPTTSPPTSSTPSTPSSSTTTSTTTTTLARQLTTPIDPPSDPDASEPVIEVARIAIPDIGVDAMMYHGIRNTTLDYGPGHWPGSAVPGQIGNVVVAGHRTSKHQVFRDLDQLEAGDEIVFTDLDGTTSTYLVRDVEIVPPTALWIVDPTDTPTVTLFACHPPGSTAERIVVYGDLAT
jgi:sortase A